LLTVNPKALTITANNVTQAFSNVPFSGGNGVIGSNGDALKPVYVIQLRDGKSTLIGQFAPGT